MVPKTVVLLFSLTLIACTGTTEETVDSGGAADADASSARDADASTPEDASTDADESSPDADTSPPADADAAQDPDAGSDAGADADDSGDAGNGEESILGGVGSSPSDEYPPTGPVTSADWWVDGDTGDDSNSGTSRDDPFATLGHALQLVSDGERIIVEGTLTPTDRISLDDDYDSGVEIFNYGSDQWELDFSSLSDTKAIMVTGSGYHLKGVEIHSVPVEQAVSISTSGHNVMLEDFEIHHVEADAIQSYGGSFNIFQDGLIYHMGDGSTANTNTGDCIALTGPQGNPAEFSHDNYVIRTMCINGPDDGYDMFRGYDNYFIDSVTKDSGRYWNGNPGSTSGGDGAGFKMGGEEGSGGNHFIGCIAVDSRSSGFSHNSASEPCTVSFSTAVGSGGFGFDMGNNDSPPAHILEDSIGYDNDGGDLYANTDEMVNNSWDLGITDPQLYDAEGGDCSLEDGSPARGAAQNGDHLGASRAALELLLENWHVE